MKAIDLKTIVSTIQGRWIGRPAPESAPVAEVSTDTRTLGGGAVFVALHGKHFDGHRFVGRARRAGAVASVVAADQLPFLPPGDGPYIAVADPLSALVQLAGWYRRQLRVRVVTITGSVGKTSTKEFLGTLLGERFRVKVAPKSYNNLLGVSQTLLLPDSETEVLVVEMGTSAPGELSQLSKLARPDRVVITEVAPVHLDGLGSIDGVLQEKAGALDGLAPDGEVHLRAGIYGFDHFCSRTARPVHTFGWDGGDLAISGCQRVGLGTAAAYGYHYSVQGENFLLPVPGRHNVLNALAAMSVARDFGLTWSEIRSALSCCRLPPMRLQVVEENGIVYLNDAYNASPRSMEAAITEWTGLGLTRNGNEPAKPVGVAVLGDMLELGSDSRGLHEAIGCQLSQLPVRLLVTVGRESQWISKAYEELGGSAVVRHFAAVGDAVPFLCSATLPGDRVLLKGSRRVGLEKAFSALRRQSRPGAGAWASQGPATSEARATESAGHP